MKPQDEIICETEITAEQCRQNIYEFQTKISDPIVKKCCLLLENYLFEFVVMLYTHRTIWTQPGFWNAYATSTNPTDFSENAYKQMIQSTLSTMYLKLYFCIEGALYQYFPKSNRGKNPNILNLYSKLDKKIIVNYDEINEGLKILRCVRNSHHGDDGTYTFSYNNEGIYFKGERYFFQKGNHTTVSYKFIRDFLPSINEIYRALFSTYCTC